MNPGNKGQGAFEYLMAYGWAIIVLLIIGATLWYLGVFNVEQMGVTVSGFSKIKPLETSILLTPDGNFSGIFVNGAGYVINVSNITITNMVGPPSKECNITNGTGNKRRDEQFWIRATDCVDGVRPRGTPYTLYVNISYSGRVGGTDISRLERGAIHGFYEFYLQITTTSVTTTTSTSTTSTSTTSTSTTSTSTSSTTSTSTTAVATTSIASSSVMICSGVYDCGDSDSVCPENYGVTCSDPDC